MLKTLKTIGTIILMYAVGNNLFAQEKNEQPSVNISSDIGIHSQFNVHGMRFSEGMVVQPSTNVSLESISGTIWGNYDNGTRVINEIDLIIDYTKEAAKGVTLNAGIGYYIYPNTETKTSKEIFGGVSIETLLNPKLKLSHDFGAGAGTYAELAISKNFKIVGIPITAEGSIGYNDHKWRSNSGLSHLKFGLVMPIEISDKVIITPTINQIISLDKNYDEILGSPLKNQTYGGANITFGF
ncbi:MAG: hypothetical protein KJ583_05155 [Nanoarchaeota archaeon]|nr:hypothetical protein [Nanoarchaeota archaeon]MBU1270362.1 hypothetical protein [Nanoarchaeota archaeon]MBU1604677.1 hypothetical protein [Nanoarchaeota archaeon]MBU2443359.1 hypothetical protein [Nanoarchaeota archaeon]